MRTRLLLPCLSVLLLAGPLRPARADEAETERLARRVDLLLDVVADLRAELDALRARVAALEAERGGAPVASAPAEAEAAPGPTPPAPPAVPGVAGAYVMDRRASVEAMLDRTARAEGLDEDGVMAARASLETEFAGRTVNLVIRPAGTFTAQARSEDVGTAHTAEGTWTHEGENPDGSIRLRLVTTQEDGEAPDRGETLNATLHQDGTLQLESEDGSFVLVFHR